MHDFLPFIVAGLATGAVYGVAGLGLVLTYKTSGIFNFGYGAVAALAAIVFYVLHTEHGMPWPWAVVVTLAVFAPIAGIGLEVMARSLDGAPERIKVVATVGLILIVQAIAMYKYPTSAPPFPHFLPQSTVRIAGVNVTWEQIILLLFSVAASALLYWFFRYVRLGIAMRAIVDSQELVSMCQYNPVRVRRSAWIIGTVFASIAGLMLAPGLLLDGVSLTTVVFAAFGAAAIGYFTNLPLTFAGGLLIGVAGSLTDKYAGTISWIGGIPAGLPFIILFIVLIVTPRRRLASLRIAPPTRVRVPYQAPARIRLLAGAIAIVLLAFIPTFQSGYIALWSNALINIILFLSLGLLVRNSGQISLCHLAFAAVGAASFGHFINLGLPWLLALICASLVAVPVGALIAIPAVRVSGVFLALATLGFGILAQSVFYTRDFMFGLTSLGVAAPRPDVSIGGLDLSSDKGFYYLLLFITVLVVLLITAVKSGRLGRLLRAMGDSQLALETRGATSSVTKVIVFCLTAALAALAGALTGMLYHFSVGDYFQPFSSLTLVVLVVIITTGDPWYAVIAAVSQTVIPGYVHGPNVTTTLLLLFGLGAVFSAYTTRLGAMPRPVQTLLDRLGGRRPRPAANKDGTPLRKAISTPTGPPRTGGGLVVSGLSVAFGGVLAVDSLDLTAPPGRITGLIGPNGAGKSTTFNACSGLVRPSSGHVLLHEAEVNRLGPSRRARKGLGRTFQRPQLFTSLSVRENIAMGREASMAGANPLTQLFDRRAANTIVAASVEDALAITGTHAIADVQVGLLPIGQRRLVELATVLAGPFDMLLLDEPSSGLDGRETDEFARVLRTAVEERGIGVLIVEHDMTLVRQICDYIYVLDFGRLIFEGTMPQMEQSDQVRAAYLGDSSLVDDLGGFDAGTVAPVPSAASE